MLKIGRSLLRRPLRNGFRLFSEAADGEIVKRESNVPTGNSGNFRYVDGELVPIGNLVLRERESIEEYVLKTVKNYFRTTYKSGLTLDSKLVDHNIDSLDAIEIAMQIEEDLNYKIASENLSVFHKVKHYVNYIEQVEKFKDTYSKQPLP